MDKTSKKFEPNFQRILDVLGRKPTTEPVLFEFIISEKHLRRLVGTQWRESRSPADTLINMIEGFRAGGYDYTMIGGGMIPSLYFPFPNRDAVHSAGMAHGGVVTDSASLRSIAWPQFGVGSWKFLDDVRPHIPQGMKLIATTPGGMLTTLIAFFGYEDLCIALYENPALVEEAVEIIGKCSQAYYAAAFERDEIGALAYNDDWGFKTQTLLSPEQMRKWIFPWVKSFVDQAHAAGHPAILHSCGCMGDVVWEDIIEHLGFDGKHSYEDVILPVEEAYRRYSSRIAILGGLDMDFLARSTPEQVTARCYDLIALTQERGGYALGSGNSTVDYIPTENFDAMRASRAMR